MSKILTTAGAVLFLNGAYLLVRANLNLGIYLTVLLGMFFLAWGMLYEKIKKLSRNKIVKVIKAFVIIVLCAEALFVCFIAAYGYRDDVGFDEDAVIVPGAGIRGDKVTASLKLRLDAAAEYHKLNPGALIVVSGGMGKQETVTEAEAMEKYLISVGVDETMIIKEERSTSTRENMRFSKQLLDEYFDGEYKTAVITNHFHIYRASKIAASEGLGSVSHMHAGLQWHFIVPNYLRESAAILEMWVFG